MAQSLALRISRPYAHVIMFLGVVNKSGIVGRAATIGGVCFMNRKKRTAITNWHTADPQTAMVFLVGTNAIIKASFVLTFFFVYQTFTHEIGHLLGMNHDFDNRNRGNRYDSQGRLCTRKNGVMDYNSVSRLLETSDNKTIH